MKKREDIIADRLFMAGVSQQSNRYDDMYLCMKELVKNKNTDCTIEERNMVAVSFKRVILRDRKAVDFVSDIIASGKFNQFTNVLNVFREKLHI
jgi:hypothetical protein